MRGPAETRQYVRIIDAQADRLQELIRDLLDVARIESGNLAIERAPVELARLIDEARNAFLSGGGRDDIVLDLDPDLDPDLAPVSADPRRIVQVLGDLLANADKHSPESSPIALAATRAGVHLVISVADRTGRQNRGRAARAIRVRARPRASGALPAAGPGDQIRRTGRLPSRQIPPADTARVRFAAGTVAPAGTGPGLRRTAPPHLGRPPRPRPAARPQPRQAAAGQARRTRQTAPLPVRRAQRRLPPGPALDSQLGRRADMTHADIQIEKRPYLHHEDWRTRARPYSFTTGSLDGVRFGFLEGPCAPAAKPSQLSNQQPTDQERTSTRRFLILSSLVGRTEPGSETALTAVRSAGLTGIKAAQYVELCDRAPRCRLVAGVMRRHRRRSPAPGRHQAGELDTRASQVLGHPDAR